MNELIINILALTTIIAFIRLLIIRPKKAISPWLRYAAMSEMAYSLGLIGFAGFMYSVEQDSFWVLGISIGLIWFLLAISMYHGWRFARVTLFVLSFARLIIVIIGWIFSAFFFFFYWRDMKWVKVHGESME